MKRSVLLLLSGGLLVLPACGSSSDDDDDSTAETGADGDGVTVEGGDGDDADATVHPTAFDRGVVAPRLLCYDLSVLFPEEFLGPTTTSPQLIV